MKSLKILAIGIAGGLVTAALVSCTKSFKDPQPQNTDLNNNSLVQLFVATVNANRNVVMVDGKRVSRPTLTSGTSFPTAVYPSTNTGHAFAVPGGLRSFLIMDTLATTTQKPLAFSSNMQVGSRYTIFMYDTITNPKQITVPTNIEIPTDNTARLRFANFIHDAADTPPVDVYSNRRGQNIFTGIGKTGVTDFISYTTSLNDTLVIRQSGTSTVLAQFNNFNPTEKRSYTLVYRGSHRGTKAATVFANY